MDHMVKAAGRRPVLCRLVSRRRFESPELESLYQRYTFKLQHSSVISAVSLFLLLTAAQACLSLAYSARLSPQSVYHLLHSLLLLILLVFLTTR